MHKSSISKNAEKTNEIVVFYNRKQFCPLDSISSKIPSFHCDAGKGNHGKQLRLFLDPQWPEISFFLSVFFSCSAVHPRAHKGNEKKTVSQILGRKKSDKKSLLEEFNDFHNSFASKKVFTKTLRSKFSNHSNLIGVKKKKNIIDLAPFLLGLTHIKDDHKEIFGSSSIWVC